MTQMRVEENRILTQFCALIWFNLMYISEMMKMMKIIIINVFLRKKKTKDDNKKKESEKSGMWTLMSWCCLIGQ